jgi:hypothetical protein
MKLLDYQTLVDEIKDVVYSPTMADAERLRSLASAYDKASDEVNDRLRQSGALLKQGLRDEALGLCEIKPHLLEIIAILDFPEVPEWRLLLGESGINVPSPIRVEIAEELNEAYALRQPLSELLKKHRLLAMSYSPLSERLIVLRQMRELDPNNLAWNDDQAAWERVRLKQILPEAKVAKRADDEPRLLSLVLELSVDKWITKPDAQLVKEVTEMHAAVVQKTTATQLEERTYQLSAAHKDGDTARCQQLYRHIKQICETSGTSFDHEVFARVRPLLDSLSRAEIQGRLRHQQQGMIQRLDQEIVGGDSIERLEQHYEALGRLPLRIPDDVTERYQTAVRRLRSARRRRSLVRSSVGIGIFLLFSISAIGGGFAWKHSKRVDEAVAALNKHLKEHEYESAEHLVDQVQTGQPAVYRSRRFAERLVEYEKRLAIEKKRKADFDARVAELMGGKSRLTPSQISALARQARTPGEQQQIEKLKQKRLRDLNDRLEADFAIAEGEYQHIVKSAPPIDEQGLQDILDQLSSSEVRTDRNEASEELQRKFTDLLRDVEQWIKKAATGKGVERDQEMFTRHIGLPSAYRTALSDFCKAYPDVDVVKQYGKVMAEYKLWEDVLEWNKLFQHPALADATQLTPDAARELLRSGRKLVEERPVIPLNRLFNDRVDYLEHIEARGTSDEGGLENELYEMFNAPLMKEIYLAKLKHRTTANRFYVSFNPLAKNNSEDRVSFNYIAGFDGEEKPKNVRRDLLTVEQAPHWLLVEKILKRIAGQDQLHTTKWVPTYCDILKLIADDESSEIILRVNIFKKVLDVSTRGCRPMANAFAQHVKMLDDEPIDMNTPWMLQEDALAIAARERAEKLMKQLPPLDLASGKALAEDTAERKIANATLQWCAILAGNKGEWQANGLKSAIRNGRLFIITKDHAESEPRISPVADVNEGQVRWTTADPALLVTGRPLFFNPNRPSSR